MPSELTGLSGPKGSVTVTCCHPGCGWSWWVDALDPQLPGPFDCGADHQANFIRDMNLSKLRVIHGIRWCSLSEGVTIVEDRFGQKKGALRKGITSSESVNDIDWNPKDVGLMGTKRGPIAEQPGHSRWVGYQLDDGATRRYTFAPCARCGLAVMIDADNPDFRLPEGSGYAIGSYGGGEIPTPDWVHQRTWHCEDGIGSLSHLPCLVVHGPVLTDYEARTGNFWTVWETEGPLRSVLFRNPCTESYGLLQYLFQDHQVFQSVESLQAAIRWGTLEDVCLWLRKQNSHGEMRYLLDKVRAPLPA